MFIHCLFNGMHIVVIILMEGFFNPLALAAGFNCLFPQCSQMTLTMSAFNAQSMSRWLSNQLVIYKMCLAHFFLISLQNNVLIPYLVLLE